MIFARYLLGINHGRKVQKYFCASALQEQYLVLGKWYNTLTKFSHDICQILVDIMGEIFLKIISVSALWEGSSWQRAYAFPNFLS
jgi:hypothetical protein